jgi:hypothetical protein
MPRVPERAERDAHEACARASDLNAHLAVSDIIECLGRLAADVAELPRPGAVL